MKSYYLLTKKKVLEEFGVNPGGHSKERAEALLKEKGENVIQEGSGKAHWRCSFPSLQIFS